MLQCLQVLLTPAMTSINSTERHIWRFTGYGRPDQARNRSGILLAQRAAMMMTGAVAATTPASVPTDNASSKIKNPNEPDFAELLFLLLGLVSLQNLNPHD